MLPVVPSNTPTLPAHEQRRQRRALVVLLTLSLTLLLLVAHAHWSRAQRAAGPDADSPWVRALPSTTLVLSTRSRWLRHPYLAEPGAAFQDGPGFLDADPAGALQSPPQRLYASEVAP